jgi:hypothetical protein
MLTLGTAFYSPSAKFAVTRSYVKKIAFTTGGWPTEWDGTLFRVYVGSPLVYINNVLFNPKFIAWSSNVYSLDYIVEQCYYQVPPLFAHNPSTIGVNWFPNDDPPTPSLQIDFIATGYPLSRVTLPPAPGGWWSG